LVFGNEHDVLLIRSGFQSRANGRVPNCALDDAETAALVHNVIQATAAAFASESRTVTMDGAVEALALLGAGNPTFLRGHWENLPLCEAVHTRLPGNVVALLTDLHLKPTDAPIPKKHMDWTQPHVAVYSVAAPIPPHPHPTLRDLGDHGQERAIEVLTKADAKTEQRWQMLRHALSDEDDVPKEKDPFSFERILVATVEKIPGPEGLTRRLKVLVSVALAAMAALAFNQKFEGVTRPPPTGIGHDMLRAPLATVVLHDLRSGRTNSRSLRAPTRTRGTA
jgi:hypothetical protein